MNRAYVPETQKGAFGNVTAWIAASLVLAGVIAAVFFAVEWATAPAKGKLEARKAINSGSFRIAAYDHFFNLCASVQTDDARLDAQATELSTATGDDIQRVQANIAGLTADRAEAINEYNADARKSYTIGQFRSSQLPYQLPTDPHVKGEAISCGA